MSQLIIRYLKYIVTCSDQQYINASNNTNSNVLNLATSVNRLAGWLTSDGCFVKMEHSGQ